jgi:thioredoxin-like negative regulator of GroEL
MNKKNSENGNENKVRELLSSNKPLLLEVRAECCDHSIFIETIIRKIENEFDNSIRIARIDYQTYKNLLPGTDVENFPTVLLIKDKNVSKVINGTISRTNLKALANEVLESNQTTEEEKISSKQ